jgi:peptidoglycan/LPS O-acetylase OafA/YrhL
MAAPTSPNRLHFLDWLRILALAWLIPYHVGMYYVSWDWHLKSPFASTTLEPWMRLSAPWRMSLLFLVAGAATAFMLQRQGASVALLGQRAKRLLLPLLAGMLVIVPPQPYLQVVQQVGYAGDYLDFLRLYFTAYHGFCRSGGCLVLPTWNHLWFLPYLFVYTLALWGLLRAWPAALDRLATALGRAFAGAGLVLWPVLALALLRFWMAPRFPITHALVDDPFAHAQYLSIFVLGAALARHGELWSAMDRQRWPAGVAAIAGWALLLSTDGGTVPGVRPLAFATQQWCAIVAAVGFAHRHLNRDNTARRWLTDAVFPVYVLHQTVIVLGIALLAPLALHPAVEAPLLIAGTLLTCLAVFVAARGVPWLRPWLGLGPLRSAARPATSIRLATDRPRRSA